MFPIGISRASFPVRYFLTENMLCVDRICDSVLFGYKLLISILVMKIAQFQRINGHHYVFIFSSFIKFDYVGLQKQDFEV